MKHILSFLLACLVCLNAPAATTTSITQFGITFTFSEAEEYGQFADGSYYVVGPVTVTAMTPDWTGTHNGWEVNPTVSSTQGFYGGGFGYSAAKRPALPLTISDASTLVKTIGLTPTVDHSNIKTAVALTVLTNAPSGGGALYFRPPYVGTEKPLIPVSDLRDDLLPSMAVTASAPSLATVVANFSKCLRMDHHSTHARQFRPKDAMFGYSPNNAPTLNEAMLRLMGDESYASKEAAVIQFAQHALDRAYASYLGYRNSGTGHNPNQRVLAAWGAVMLDLTTIKTYLTAATGYHEDRYLYHGINAVLWGESSTELKYWDYVVNDNGAQSPKDPYSLIDGGRVTDSAAGGVGSTYQRIVSQSLKGQALVYRLFPQLRATVIDARIAALDEYAERWVTNGAWTSPDPAAANDGIWANYGSTYGPNGAGSYIAGSGRSTQWHGVEPDAGQYKSAFVASMWTAYAAGDAPPADVTDPVISAISSGTPGATVATITATIDEESFTGIKYGTTMGGPYGSTATNNLPTTSLSFDLTGLTASTTYYYQLVATDAAGNTSAWSTEASFTTTASDVNDPSVSMTAPGNSATVSGDVTLSATASDNVAVARVDFYVSTVLTYSDDTSPYSVTWESANGQYLDGSYELYAVAVDTSGNDTQSTSINVTLTSAVPTPLVAHWALDGDVTDSAGANDGTIVGTPTSVSAVLPWDGSGYEFSATGDRITVPAFDISGSIFTVTAWARPFSIPGSDPRVVARGSSTTDEYWGLILDIGSNAWKFRLRTETIPASLYSADDSVALNEWVYLVGTYDGATMRFYVNGVEVSNRALTGGLRTGSAPVWIADVPTTASRRFHGQIGDVKLYSVALDATQVAAQFLDESDVPAPAVPENLIATSISTSSISITWEAPASVNPITDWLVYRGPAADDLTLLSTITDEAQLTYTDSTVSASTSYYYGVAARSNGGDSEIATLLATSADGAAAAARYGKVSLGRGTAAGGFGE